MSTDSTTVPEVYSALSKVLTNFRAEKDGKLPNSLGGKSYVTAQAAAAAVKEQFIANDLIFVPNEEQLTKEIINDNGRKTVAISIRGEYTVISTVDGSSVTFSGIGDGLAVGTAVSSNIASTNALKNALLRLTLTTEQTTEDQAKNGTDEPEPARKPSQSKIDAARRPAPAKPSNEPAPDTRGPQEDDAAAESEIAELKGRIRKITNGNEEVRTQVNARWTEIATELKKPKGTVEVLSKLAEEFGA